MYIPNRYTYNFKLKYTVLEEEGNQDQYEKYVTREQAENRMVELNEYLYIRDLSIEEIQHGL